MRRHSLSQPTHCLITARWRYVCLSSVTVGIPSRLLIVFVRNHWKNVMLLEPVADALLAIGFIGGQLLWFFASSLLARGDEGCNHRLKALRFIHLPGAEFDTQRSSRAVSNQVEFRSKPTSAAAQKVVLGFVAVPPETFCLRRQRRGRLGR